MKKTKITNTVDYSAKTLNAKSASELVTIIATIRKDIAKAAVAISAPSSAEKIVLRKGLARALTAATKQNNL